MPLISIKASTEVEVDSSEFLKKLSRQLADLTGKPESYVMTILEPNKEMTFGGSSEPCCYIEIKSIGSISPKVFSKELCQLIYQETNIPMNRIYIHFEDVIASNWGFNSSTFG